MFPNDEEKDEAQSLKSVSREVLEGLTLGHLVPAAVHSSKRNLGGTMEASLFTQSPHALAAVTAVE